MTEQAQTEKSIEAAPQKKLAMGVEFHRAGKIYTFIAGDDGFAMRDKVVVESDDGIAVGEVVRLPYEPKEGELAQNAKRVLRKATPEEVLGDKKKKEKALEYMITCQDKVREHNLPMKLVDATLEENGRKVVFVFFSEQRVDFRNLVRDLANALHMRIELRQVGARDESKHKGCMGPCGQVTCCSLYLRQFQSISISMAKHQGLAPNPAKLTGMCGKLKCCLAYEEAVYEEYRKDLPKTGVCVSCPAGSGKVSGHNVLTRECIIKLFSGGESRVPCHQCRVLSNEEKEAAITAAREAFEAGEDRSARQRGRTGSAREDRAKKDRKRR